MGTDQSRWAAPDARAIRNLVGAGHGVAGAAGWTGTVGADRPPEPATVWAVTVKVYAVPFCRLLTTADVRAPPTATSWPPGEAVTV
jgi:hypothetical protein